MIEEENLIIMCCDRCGGALTDNFGYTIRLSNDIACCRRNLTKIATEAGWKCSEDSCLCPACKEEAAK